MDLELRGHETGIGNRPIGLIGRLEEIEHALGIHRGLLSRLQEGITGIPIAFLLGQNI